MSLDFSVEKMKNFYALTSYPNPHDPDKRIWHPVTNALIWATMGIGMNEITADNWRDFYFRIHMWEESAGYFLFRRESSGDPKNAITPLEVYMHIGLHTNASRKTEAQFLKDCFEANKRYLSADEAKVKAEYDALGLESMSYDDYSAAQMVEDRKDLADIGSLVKRWRETNPMKKDEDIDSI